MPSVFWLAAYNPHLTWAQLTQQAIATDCWAVTFLLQNAPLVERDMLFYIWNEILLGNSFFYYEYFEEMCSSGSGKEEKYPVTLERREGGWTRRNWDTVLVLASHRKVEKHAVDGPKKISPLGWRLQNAVLKAFYPGWNGTQLSQTECLYSHTFTQHENPNQRAVRRGRDHTDMLCGRGCMRKMRKLEAKMMSHLLWLVTSNHPPCWLGKTCALCL